MTDNQRIFNLIEGSFNVPGAVSILMSLYNEKINYHNRLLLGMKERNDKERETVEAKVNELVETRQAVYQFLTSESQKDKLVNIHCLINIEFM